KTSLFILALCALLACDNSPQQQYPDNKPNPSTSDTQSDAASPPAGDRQTEDSAPGRNTDTLQKKQQ
ncbi:MAG: hypothetical protein ACTHLE_26650, partial [Agriterribacter sp.]